MNYSGIKYADMINGKGIRVSLFVSGCTHCCKNCFNEETWNETYGKKFTEKEENEIIEYFKKYGKTIRGLSLLGGDPTYPKNIKPLLKFIKKFKEYNLNPRNFGWRGIRTQDYTYIIELGYDVVPNPKRYLYHTSEDKYQLNPLDLDKKENKLLAETFENQIKDWLKRQNDGFLQNWEKNSAAF